MRKRTAGVTANKELNDWIPGIISTAKLGKRSASSPVLPRRSRRNIRRKEVTPKKTQPNSWHPPVPWPLRAIALCAVWLESCIKAGLSQSEWLCWAFLAGIQRKSVHSLGGSRKGSFPYLWLCIERGHLCLHRRNPAWADWHTPSPCMSTAFSTRFSGKSNPSVSKHSIYIFIQSVHSPMSI